jgi:predicted dehydrogenase
MARNRIRVGVVGASPDRGWAAVAHLPALAHLEEFELTAVATTRPETATRAAAAFGARHAFASAAELAGHPDVDLVVVSVRAPRHAEVIRPALAAGKHVLSEWPLGVDLAEAVDLAAAAEAAGVVHAVVLQVVHSPSARFVRDLVAAGRIGRLDGIALVAAGDPLGGSRVSRDLAWAADAAAGNTVLTIMAGHALAALEHVAGPLADVTALVERRDDEVTVLETGQRIPNTAPGQVALLGRLTGGAVATLAVQGGARPGPDGFLLQLAGSDGTLTVTPAEPGMYPGWATWSVSATGPDGVSTELPLPARYRTLPPGVPAGPPAHVAGTYQEVAAAIRDGRPAQPSFRDAVRYHQLLDAAARSAATGSRQLVRTGGPA